MRLTPRRRSSFQLSPTETVLIVPIEYNEIQWYNDGWTWRWLDIISFFSLNIQVTVMAPVIIRDVHNALHCQQCQCVDEVDRDRQGQIIEDFPTRADSSLNPPPYGPFNIPSTSPRVPQDDYWEACLGWTLVWISVVMSIFRIDWIRRQLWMSLIQAMGSGISTNLHSLSSCFFFVFGFYLPTRWRHLTRRLYGISKS